jgi:hypothetical protein
MLVYSAPIRNEDAFHQRLFYACQTIRNALGAFEMMLKSMVRCVYVCIDSGGVHFKHLLWIVTWQTVQNSTVIKYGMCIVNVLCSL